MPLVAIGARLRAIYPAFGAAPGPPCAPTFAAAILATSGPKTPPLLKQPPERSRGEREWVRALGSQGKRASFHATSFATRLGATSR